MFIFSLISLKNVFSKFDMEKTSLEKGTSEFSMLFEKSEDLEIFLVSIFGV